MATPVTQGLVMRLDATALQLADGAAVDQWPDLSGLGHHAVQADPTVRRFDAGQPLAGDIAEMLVYDRRLSDTEISSIETYLQVKWFTDPDGPPVSAPLLATVVGGQLVVAWPASAQGVVLQQTAPGAFPGGWTSVTTQVVEQGGNNTVTVDLSGLGQYYRLAPAQ